MKTVLVTGATGFIGSRLVAALTQRGNAVRAFHRKESNPDPIKEYAVEHRTGDIRDINALRAAMDGCSEVFHTAALVTFWSKRKEEQLDINVNGTRAVVEACVQSGVRSLIHTSSVAALGHSTDGSLIDEQTPFNWGEHITYKFSKHRAELEVLNGVSRGLDAKIVNPTVVIGPGDAKLHGGQAVRDIALGRIPAYVAGGMNIVGVHDVVAGHLAAAEKGKPGERYILGGLNLTHKDVFALIARTLGKSPPRLKAPVWSVRTIAKIFDIVGAVTSSEPWINSELISGIGKNNWYSSEKAKNELGYVPSPIEPVILETFEWYQRHGII